MKRPVRSVDGFCVSQVFGRFLCRMQHHSEPQFSESTNSQIARAGCESKLSIVPTKFYEIRSHIHFHFCSSFSQQQIHRSIRRSTGAVSLRASAPFSNKATCQIIGLAGPTNTKYFLMVQKSGDRTS